MREDQLAMQRGLMGRALPGSGGRRGRGRRLRVSASAPTKHDPHFNSVVNAHSLHDYDGAGDMMTGVVEGAMRVPNSAYNSLRMHFQSRQRKGCVR